VAESPSVQVTRLLREWSAGDESVPERLVPLLYDELQRLAAHHLRSERRNHSLQATDLVNEALLRLLPAEPSWNDRKHFFTAAARTMRRVLVDHARKRKATRRGHGWVQTALTEGLVLNADPAAELIVLDAVLVELTKVDERAARAAELHYFAGLSYADVSRVLEISEATVHRDLRFARAWLQRRLDADAP
jgi:RNA polymerase sigma factor (TIGR02999 family)